MTGTIRTKPRERDSINDSLPDKGIEEWQIRFGSGYDEGVFRKELGRESHLEDTRSGQ